MAGEDLTGEDLTGEDLTGEDLAGEDLAGDNSAGTNLPDDRIGNSAPVKPRAKMFACKSCGAPVTVQYPGASLSAVCSKCLSVIDVTDENYKILSTFHTKAGLFKPDIPLGTRGKLKGHTWEMIGFMVRDDVASSYFWSEYLLFNPYYGYRWLVEDNGYWNFVTTIKRKPDTRSLDQVPTRGTIAELDGHKYSVYNHGRARVKFVLGEFYWRVVVGSEVLSVDYIDPPRMLSAEKDGSEIVWSVGEYIEAKEVWEAFQLKTPLPYQSGTPATYPAYDKATYKKIGFMWCLFITFITCVQFYFSCTARNQMVYQYDGIFTPNTKKADITTKVFKMEGDLANVSIIVKAPVSNSWFYISGELVNNADGTSYPFEQTVEYYYGVDSDGSWTEGSGSSERAFSSIPAGQYYLNVDTESGSFTDSHDQQYSIIVGRNMPIYDNYWWIFAALSCMPIWAWVKMRQTETDRWANSDFSPYIYTGGE